MGRAQGQGQHLLKLIRSRLHKELRGALLGAGPLFEQAGRFLAPACSTRFFPLRPPGEGEEEGQEGLMRRAKMQDEILENPAFVISTLVHFDRKVTISLHPFSAAANIFKSLTSLVPEVPTCQLHIM